MDIQPWHRHYDYDVPFTIRYPEGPVQTWLHYAASQFPDKPALWFLGAEMTFREVREEMLRLANALGALGVAKGDRVGIALPNSPQYVISYYAVLSLGAIVVNLNPLYTAHELRFMMSHTGVSTLITSDAALCALHPLTRELGIRLVVTRLSDYAQSPKRNGTKGSDLSDLLGPEKEWHYFSGLIEDCRNVRVPRVPFSPQDPALIQFTGGTTGLPKGALISHENIVAALFQARLWSKAITEVQPVEKRFILSAIPYFHIYGNIVALNWAVHAFATQILIPSFQIDTVLETISRFDRISFFPAVPTMITAVLNNPDAEKLHLGKRIGFLTSGGAPMPGELIDRVKDCGMIYGEGWGMSETTSVGINNPLLRVKRGSIGVPVPDVQVRLVDTENGTDDVKQGEPGEIILKGPNVMGKYWENAEETSQQIKDGWLYTGDVAQQDEEGYYYIVDRKKDMIIAGGFNIYPREVDEVLYEHPKIAEAVTVGVPDTYRGETVKAFIVLKSGEEATEQELMLFCREKLAPYKVPKKVEFRASLPKSAVGKILRKILREEEARKVEVNPPK